MKRAKEIFVRHATSLCLALMLAISASASSATVLAPNCKPEPQLAQTLRDTPTAAAYNSAGAWFASKGDLNCAVAAFQQAILMAPRASEPHFNLGALRQRMQQPEEAIQEFRSAIQDDPSLLRAHAALGSALLQVNRTALAESEFRTLLQLDPTSASASSGLAQALVNEGHYHAALGYWNRALAAEPTSTELQLAVAETTYQAAHAMRVSGHEPPAGTDVPDAIRMFLHLLQAHPDLTAAHFSLANLYANEQLYREAAAEYREVLKLDPASSAALLSLAQALVSVPSFTEALQPAQTYVGRNPVDGVGHLLLGEVYRGLGDLQGAKAQLALAVQQAPDNFQARDQFGAVLASLDLPAEAVVQLRRAAALKPSDSSVPFQLAAVLRRLGQTDEAKKISEAVQLEHESEYVEHENTAEGNRANEDLKAGHPEAAVAVYREVLRKAPPSAWAEYNLATALEAQGAVKEEREALDAAVRLDPKMAVAQAKLGQVQLAEGDLQAARESLASALALQPELAPARSNLAVVFARAGHLRQAETQLRQAIEDDPQCAEAHLNLGLILAQEGNDTEAEQQLHQAVFLAPKDLSLKTRAGEAEKALALSHNEAQ